MSHVVHFWAFPTPKSLAHATEIFNGLPRQGRPQNRLFPMLAQRLTARFPCITQLDDDDPRAVWSDGPLDGITDSATFALGILSDRVDEVHPFVVETATTLGLVVYDEQLGEVYLPGGTQLDRERHRIGRHLGVPVDGPLGTALVERTVMNALHPLLASEGFELDRAFGGLTRTHAGGTQALRLRSFVGGAAFVAFDIDIVLIDHGVRKTVEHLLLGATQGREKHVATAIGSLATASRFFRVDVERVAMQDDTSQRFELQSVDELRAMTIALRRLVADHLRPALDNWLDRDQIAISLHSRAHENFRTVGSLVRVDEVGLSSALIGKQLLSTRRCGGAMTGVLLAALARAPTLQAIVDEAYTGITHLPPDQLATEKAKLDMCVAALRETRLLG